jgi:Pyridine nucleotide-disulphide oxidoreductase, dimerisation domain
MNAAEDRLERPDPQTLVAPDDAYNRALVANVRPPRWQNPTPAGRYNLVVLGAGTAGLGSAIGEMIGEMSLAITASLSLGDVARTIHPYPTQAEAWKRLGDAWNRTRLTPRVRRLFERFLALWR